MSTTLVNMGLVKWDLTSDYFSHTQLAANFDAIDAHDHTGGGTKGVQIPAGGLATNAVTTTAIAANAVTTAKITDANVTDTKLASPNNGIWKTLWEVSSFFPASTITSSGVWFPTYAGPVKTAVSGTGSVPTFYIPALANYAVSSKTINHRLTIILAANATANTATFTGGIYPVTVSSATANQITYTAGSVVTNSSTAATSSTASSVVAASNSNTSVTLSATTAYAIGVNMSAAMTTNSAVNVYVRVEYSHV